MFDRLRSAVGYRYVKPCLCSHGITRATSIHHVPFKAQERLW